MGWRFVLPWARTPIGLWKACSRNRFRSGRSFNVYYVRGLLWSLPGVYAHLGLETNRPISGVTCVASHAGVPESSLIYFIATDLRIVVTAILLQASTGTIRNGTSPADYSSLISYIFLLSIINNIFYIFDSSYCYKRLLK